MIFGGIKYVKGCTNSNSCSPDPTTCYPVSAPITLCQDLISNVSSTYLSSNSIISIFNANYAGSLIC